MKDEWYGAQLYFRCSSEDSDEVLVDSRIYLIRAPDKAAAIARAEVVGREHEDSCRNGDGEEVVWTFEGVVRVSSINEETLEHGVEVFSRLDWAD